MFLLFYFCHLRLSSFPSQPPPVPSSSSQLLHQFFLFTHSQLLPLLTFASPHLSLFYFFNLVFSHLSLSSSLPFVIFPLLSSFPFNCGTGDTQLVVSGIFESYLTTACSDPAMNKVVLSKSPRTLRYYHFLYVKYEK